MPTASFEKPRADPGLAADRLGARAASGEVVFLPAASQPSQNLASAGGSRSRTRPRGRFRRSGRAILPGTAASNARKDVSAPVRRGTPRDRPNPQPRRGALSTAELADPLGKAKKGSPHPCSRAASPSTSSTSPRAIGSPPPERSLAGQGSPAFSSSQAASARSHGLPVARFFGIRWDWPMTGISSPSTATVIRSAHASRANCHIMARRSAAVVSRRSSSGSGSPGRRSRVRY